jgi:hypothetical protein
LAQFFENENMISENTCEMFMNDVMEEKCLQEYEIIPNIQIESNQNPMKENIKKLHFQKQFGNCTISILYVGLFFV